MLYYKKRMLKIPLLQQCVQSISHYFYSTNPLPLLTNVKNYKLCWDQICWRNKKCDIFIRISKQLIQFVIFIGLQKKVNNLNVYRKNFVRKFVQIFCNEEVRIWSYCIYGTNYFAINIRCQGQIIDSFINLQSFNFWL